MTVDIQTVVLCSILVLLAFTTPLCNALFRRPTTKKRISSSANDCTPTKFSVIITAHDKGKELERNLPTILSQNYEPGFEVIVVDESSTDDTDDVLTRLKNKFPNLYTTFIPESSHYLSRRKLALTIGIKAAKNEWLILTDADCQPESSDWLKGMSRYCDGSSDIVLGYTNYKSDAKLFYRFERLLTACHSMRKAQRGMAYRYNGNNLAIRKSLFMSHNGFIRNLKYLRGEYDFIVNEYASCGHTAAVALEPETFTRQEEPSRKTWKNEHLYYMETRRHLKRSLPYRTIFNIDNLLLHTNYLFEISVLTYSVVTSDAILATAASLSIIVTVALRIIIALRTAKAFKEHLNVFAIPFMEIRIIWQNAWFMLRHRFSDRYDFIRN